MPIKRALNRVSILTNTISLFEEEDINFNYFAIVNVYNKVRHTKKSMFDLLP